ncbi:hypothetical protein HBH69_056940 [Parastagonospora nodorum]|nr:hypothetical protein HBH69_056940 [Parastagonospora nodorum]
MDDLREAIKLVRPKNIERKRWVPESRLTQLLTKDAVYTVLAASSIQKYRLEDIVRDVVRSGKKTLAILILLDRPELIVCLIEDDQLQHKIHVDSKLPYTLEKLTSLFNHDAFANKFYDKQWEFTAPVFSGSIVPRVLHDDVILPFIAEEPLESGIGGFGTVYVTTIEPSHQRLLGIKVSRRTLRVDSPC